MSRTWHEQLAAVRPRLPPDPSWLDKHDVDLRGRMAWPVDAPPPFTGETAETHLRRIMSWYGYHMQREQDWRPVTSEEPGKLVCSSAPTLGSMASAWWNVGARPPGPEPRCRRDAYHEGRCTDGIWHWDHPRTPPEQRQDAVRAREQAETAERARGRVDAARRLLQSLGWTVAPPEGE